MSDTKSIAIENLTISRNAGRSESIDLGECACVRLANRDVFYDVFVASVLLVDYIISF